MGIFIEHGDIRQGKGKLTMLMATDKYCIRGKFLVYSKVENMNLTKLVLRLMHTHPQHMKTRCRISELHYIFTAVILDHLINIR